MQVRQISVLKSRAAVGGVLALVLLLAVPAFACTPSPDFTSNQASAEPGSAVELKGSNFDAQGMPVKILWSQADSEPSQVLLSVAPNDKGEFKATVTVPAGSQPGFYDLRATQTRSTGDKKVAYLYQGRFQVLAPGEQPAAPAGDPQPAPAQAAPSTQPDTAPQQQAAPAPQPAATTPAASPAAPATSSGGASSAAPMAPATEAPAVADEPAAPAAVAEAPATPSPKSATADLWSGFDGRGTAQVGTIDGPAQPATAPAGSLGGGIALLVVGSLLLLAGAGVAGTRRIRAKAQP